MKRSVSLRGYLTLFSVVVSNRLLFVRPISPEFRWFIGFGRIHCMWFRI